MAPSNELNDPNTDILLEGTVLNKRCQPITNAVVDIWYAGGNPSKWLIFTYSLQIFYEKQIPNELYCFDDEINKKCTSSIW